VVLTILIIILCISEQNETNFNTNIEWYNDNVHFCISANNEFVYRFIRNVWTIGSMTSQVEQTDLELLVAHRLDDRRPRAMTSTLISCFQNQES